MENKKLSEFDSFYFIGICGVSMSALAKYMLMLKKKVGGSDIADSPVRAELKSMGVHIDTGDSDALKNYDVVVYTDAIKSDDGLLKLARTLGKRVFPRGKFLREICACFGKTIAVSGCHGKTTCTSMLAHIFSAAGKKFAAHIGGNDLTYGNFVYSGQDYFITEACEYKKNFLYLKPAIAIVLNTDNDHLECYDGEEDLKRAYKKFADGAQLSVCRFGEKLLKDNITFGIKNEADYSAQDIKCVAGNYSFVFTAYGKPLGQINLKVPGRHNIFNALAAASAAYEEKISFEDIKCGLEKFNGVERRMEKIGEREGVVYLADYAHHPNEIKASLKTVKKMCEGNIFVVFQPHTYSRTKNLFKDFVEVLSDVRRLMIYRTFAAREYYDDEGSALTLSRAIKKCRYGEHPDDIAAFMSRAKYGDVVLFLGAGDIYYIAKEVISEL